MLLHRLFQAFHVAVDVAVEQFKEQAEVVSVALVRRGGHQEVMVRHGRQRLAELVGEGLLVATGGAHFVGLVHDDEIPMAAEEAFLGVFDARDPGDGGDDLVFVLPGIGAVVGAEDVAADDLEVLAELVLHFALPLEGEAGRRDDEGAFDQAANLQLLDEQAGHDGLAGARVVRQQEADAGQAEEVVVNGFELVRERVNASDGEREVGVVLEGQPEAHRFDAEPEHFGVAVKGLGVGSGFEELEFLRCQNDVHDLAGLNASADQFDRGTHRHRDDDFDRLGKDRAAKDFVGLELVKGHGLGQRGAANAGEARARWRARWPERDTLAANITAQVPPMTKSRAMMRRFGGGCSKKIRFAVGVEADGRRETKGNNRRPECEKRGGCRPG